MNGLDAYFDRLENQYLNDLDRKELEDATLTIEQTEIMQIDDKCIDITLYIEGSKFVKLQELVDDELNVYSCYEYIESSIVEEYVAILEELASNNAKADMLQPIERLQKMILKELNKNVYNRPRLW